MEYLAENKNLNTPNVVIVGAGPVGVLTANLLGLQGIPVLLIDANPGILEIPRAISLDQDALRVLQAAGFGDQIAASMPAISGIELISPFGGCFAKVNSAGSLDCHPRLVSIYQPELERILRNGLKRFSHVRLWSECTYISHIESESNIIVNVKCQGGACKITTGFLLGCDGARSTVRENQGWSMLGSSYKEDWLILDVSNLPDLLNKVEFICDPKRPVAHVPGPNGSQRWEFLLHEGETKEEMEKPNKVRELMKPWGDVSQMEVERVAVYRFQAKTVDQMGKGRVFLLGDAAHLTPPFAGQGLVSGIRDSMNLSWKLAAVIGQTATSKILSSYHTERRPHAKKTIRLAVLLGSIIMTRSKLKAIFRDFIFKFLYYTPIKRFLFDLRIRPENSFKKGLFLKNNQLTKSSIKPGTIFPQAPVKLPNGVFKFSDDLLGQSLSIVGYGTHPLTVLDADSKILWEKMGGKTLFFSNQQRVYKSDSLPPCAEDVTSTFLSVFGGLDRFLILRPDRIVAAVFTKENANQTLRAFYNIYLEKNV
ncbi:bifunctional 3-(3-hydroxy-phenyl)propionate/3-hydroxycinnamic acid hydroxylase [Leptospira noumeaensis]|uniref:Bifunctional 3-(3-hydroxy-phenyl)propionate/3-hydroxycinnamic acid hydroxylase n=1 Tax=Leptospira noumeaensis TaxID=2484964 RepID=A0A4R9I5T4_9LEPT|nr:bifunctional 3-(3-hydroxy-phenyl)propionate/3-hydroxycinnamic acid hydroxylase [Leptospira noumeaensis]TGK81441.1 bifunctional 3-(3-hydroxy-phenyl)propionate/3-hydroxycinnamic acid hydroxylase [Leptospira noumeaensis]